MESAAADAVEAVETKQKELDELYTRYSTLKTASVETGNGPQHQTSDRSTADEVRNQHYLIIAC